MSEKNFTVKIITVIAFIIGCQLASAQDGVRIAATAGTADPSAMLDVTSSTKGVLISRMTSSQRTSISNPATGLLVFQTDGTPGFYYNAGSPVSPNWVLLSAGALSGVGVTNFAARWTSSSILGTGVLYDNGTSVGIGTTSPADRLDVRSAMSVNEIKFRNLDGGDDSDPYRMRKMQSASNANWLELQLNDDPNEEFRIYGNSCVGSGCAEYSANLYHWFRADGTAFHAGNLSVGSLSSGANITSPKFRVSQVWNQNSGLPGGSSFTSGGGTLIVMMSGSGFGASARQLGMDLSIDGVFRGTARVYTNEASSHKAFTNNYLVISGLGAGSHSISVASFNGTSFDFNDFITVTILELPF